MNDPVVDILREFDPDPSAALRAAGALLREGDLEVLAMADYGMEFEEHLDGLRTIHASGDVPYPLPWNPKEVCGLTRWSGPELLDASEGTRPGDEAALTHRLRAFACAVLLRHAYNDAISLGGFSAGESDTAAPMIASALALGGELVAATRRTLSAVATVMPPEEVERGILVLGVLLCAVREGESAIPGERLNRLAWALIGEEQRQRDAGHAMGWAWLFTATFFNQRLAMWRSLARALLLEPSRPHPKEADEVLRLIGAVACEG